MEASPYPRSRNPRGYPEGFWDTPPGNPYTGYDLIRPPKGQYMKFAICHKCHSFVPAAHPTAEAPTAMVFNHCKCTACAIGYAPEGTGMPENGIIVSGPSTLVGMEQSEWDVLTDPRGCERRIMVDLFTINKSALTVMDLDVDPDDAPPPLQPTHRSAIGSEFIAVVGETDRAILVQPISGSNPSGPRRSIDRMQFYSNYVELP